MPLQRDMYVQVTLHVLSRDQATTAQRLARSLVASCMQFYAAAPHRDGIEDMSSALALHAGHTQQEGSSVLTYQGLQPNHKQQQPVAAAAHAVNPEDTPPMDEDVTEHLVQQNVAEGTPEGTVFCETYKTEHIFNSTRLHDLVHRCDRCPRLFCVLCCVCLCCSVLACLLFRAFAGRCFMQGAWSRSLFSVPSSRCPTRNHQCPRCI